MTKPFSQCSLSDLAYEISLGMPATAALILPSFTDEELQDYPYFAADILQGHPLVQGTSGLLCSDTAESKRAWCSMLRQLFSASGIDVSDAVLFRVHDVCQNCARRGYVRLSDAAVSAVVGDVVTGIPAERAGQAQVPPPHIMFDLHTERDAEVCLFPPPPLSCNQQQQQQQQQQQCWNCEVCTFENSDRHSQACGVCNFPNPHVQSWVCSACSFQNSDMDLDECGVCNFPRIFATKPRAQGVHSSSFHIMAMALNFSRPKTRRSKIFMSPRMHQWTLLSFVLAFLKPRLGGGASVAALAKKIALYDCSTRGFKTGFNDRILRRVFGGAGANIIARSARTELSRMLHEGPPVCEYMMELQVQLCHGPAVVCVSGRWGA
jgi:hypothetical protein